MGNDHLLKAVTRFQTKSQECYLVCKESLIVHIINGTNILMKKVVVFDTEPTKL